MHITHMDVHMSKNMEQGLEWCVWKADSIAYIWRLSISNIIITSVLCVYVLCIPFSWTNNLVG